MNTSTTTPKKNKKPKILVVYMYNIVSPEKLSKDNYLPTYTHHEETDLYIV